MLLIIPFIVYFLNTSPVPEVQHNSFEGKRFNNEYTIYLIQQRWHTGLIFKVKDIDSSLWPQLKGFNNAEFIDVGWGDAGFYQSPDFNFDLAYKALFTRTNSAIRVAALTIPIKKYIEFCDNAIMIKISRDYLNKLCRYISNTYKLNKKRLPIILSEQYRGNIKFYEAEGYYDLFNTCNTWIAEGLNNCGFKEISTDTILAEELFNDAQKIGIVIQVEK